MRRIMLLIVLLLSIGCNSLEKSGGLTLLLDEKWLPLEKIRERSTAFSWAIESDTAITTVGRSAYVKNLSAYLDRKPVGGLRFNATMRHEQEHSKRQLDYGLYTWIAKYSYDTDFAWKEESIGWYYELKALQRGGAQINAQGVAAALAGYRNLGGRITTFEEALQWVRDVLAGRWMPPTE